MNLLFLDLHCDALLPSGAGEFGGGNAYSRSVLNLIAKCKSINCVYITRKKVAGLADTLRLTDNIRFFRIKIGDYDLNDKDTIFLHTDHTVGQVLDILDRTGFVPDIIHSSYWPSGLVSLKINKRYNVKQIHTPLSNGKRKLLQTGHYDIEVPRVTGEESIYRNVDYVVCSSKAELEDINKLYKIDLNKLVMTGLDVNDYFRFPTYLKNGDFLIKGFGSDQPPDYITMIGSSSRDEAKWWNGGAYLYFGRLHKDKGILQIITAWLELYDEYRDFPSLWIAGGSPEQISAFRTLIKNQPLLEDAENRQKLIWWGRLSPEGISTLLLKTLAVVTHSRYETGGLMVLEALASGKPVIATPYGFAKDFLKDWDNGFIVDFGNLKKLKLRMAHFFLQPLLSSDFREKVIKSFNEAERIYGFREKHLMLYGIDKSEEISSVKKHDILPYPLQEHMPDNGEITGALKNILPGDTLHENISVTDKLTDKACTIWELRIDGDRYYCARWKNHSSATKIFRSGGKYFYTAAEQYNSNKTYIANYSRLENVYFDDAHKLIFVKAVKDPLNRNPENLAEFLSKPYSAHKNDEIFDLGAYVNKIEDMLKSYGFFFKDCERAIRSLLESAKAEKSGGGEYILFPGEADKAFFMGREAAFINGFMVTEKPYAALVMEKRGVVSEVEKDDKYWAWWALFRCEDRMRGQITAGEADAGTYEDILARLQNNSGHQSISAV